MGERQAAKWNLRKGDTLELATATIDQETGSFGQAANITVVLAGTYRSTFNELDLSRIYMRREALGDWLGRPGEFSQVALRLEDYEQDAKASVPRVREDLIEKGLLHKPREHAPASPGKCRPGSSPARRCSRHRKRTRSARHHARSGAVGGRFRGVRRSPR
ncbi:MAG: hypothetical protein R3E96_08195 [Planctomycetota bacterium]